MSHEKTSHIAKTDETGVSAEPLGEQALPFGRHPMRAHIHVGTGRASLEARAEGSEAGVIALFGIVVAGIVWATSFFPRNRRSGADSDERSAFTLAREVEAALKAVDLCANTLSEEELRRIALQEYGVPLPSEDDAE